MSEQQSLLCKTADEAFSVLAQDDFAANWPSIEAMGFATLLVSEVDGGFGGDWSDLFAVLRLAGRYAVALPVGETILAAHLLTKCHLPVPAGALSIAPRCEGYLHRDQFTGVLHHVPWGRQAAAVIARIGNKLISIPQSAVRVVNGSNPAGEARDMLYVENCVVTHAAWSDDLTALAALLRVAQIVGASERTLELAVEHVNARVQFGKPLAKLQAVQQALAMLASETAAAHCAGHSATIALDRCQANPCEVNDVAQLEIASAKLRANMAAGQVAAIAHQVHGAIGFTQEYPLQLLTRRLLGWRSEYGNDRYWSQRLGQFTMALGGRGLWEEITRRSDQLYAAR